MSIRRGALERVFAEHNAVKREVSVLKQLVETAHDTWDHKRERDGEIFRVLIRMAVTVREFTRLSPHELERAEEEEEDRIVRQEQQHRQYRKAGDDDEEQRQRRVTWETEHA